MAQSERRATEDDHGYMQVGGGNTGRVVARSQGRAGMLEAIMAGNMIRADVWWPRRDGRRLAPGTVTPELITGGRMDLRTLSAAHAWTWTKRSMGCARNARGTLAEVRGNRENTAVGRRHWEWRQ